MRGSLPPNRRRSAGSEAEELAARWLEERGYRILERNFQVRQGEIDLIVANDEVIAFVEVRSRSDSSLATPEATIGPGKVRRIVLAARHWLAKRGNAGLDIRFDVIAIDGAIGGPREIRHLPAAFNAGM